ncbi:MAG TPA: pyridoxamine 5'-phosphate oxidase family protein [Bryobacteraceae bacterium]|nr:pyridoxamine 5'-phosphate oxidase family protein [Bryobacteraceae bacterium]
MNALEREEILTKVRGWLKDAHICMLATKEPDGNLRSRPMAMQDVEFDGDLWFFTDARGHIARAVRDHPMVSISVQTDNNSTFIALSGYARLVKDEVKATELWRPSYEVFFPAGLADPDLILLRVNTETVEYWDSPSGLVSNLLNLVKGLTSDTPTPVGENRRITL